MKENDQLKDEYIDFITRINPAGIILATVLSYNDDDATISVKLRNGAVIDDVRLRSVVKAGNKKVLVPSVSSTVLIASIENSKEFVVVAVEEIDKEVLVIGDVKFDVDDTGFLLQKDADTLKQALILMNEAVQYIIVLKGRNPDRLKLQQSYDMINNLLR